MIEIAEASINSFASIEKAKAQPFDQLVTLTYSQLQDLITKAMEMSTEPLKAEIDNLMNQAAHLETETQVLKSRLQGFSDIQDNHSERINEHAGAINMLWQTIKTPPSPRGRKTMARIEDLKRILKARGGSQTFEALQDALDLTPSQFSKLISQLDKRSFEVNRRPGSKKGEKVLNLRSRIKDCL
jgi:regulator of replication initiation timing